MFLCALVLNKHSKPIITISFPSIFFSRCLTRGLVLYFGERKVGVEQQFTRMKIYQVEMGHEIIGKLKEGKLRGPSASQRWRKPAKYFEEMLERVLERIWRKGKVLNVRYLYTSLCWRHGSDISRSRSIVHNWGVEVWELLCTFLKIISFVFVLNKDVATLSSVWLEWVQLCVLVAT